MEDHNQINLEFNLEFLVDERWAGVNLREQHIQGDLKSTNYVAVSYLYVLDFSSVGLALESFDSNKLDFDGLNLKVWILTNKIATKRLIETTVDRADFTFELEFWQLWRVNF